MFVQGIQVLDTLSLYLFIYYELLIVGIDMKSWGSKLLCLKTHLKVISFA